LIETCINQHMQIKNSAHNIFSIDLLTVFKLVQINLSVDKSD